MTLDDQAAGELIARCLMIWPNHPIPLEAEGMQAFKALWVTTLGDLPLPAVQAAVLWWIADGSGWFPNPSQIRERAEHLLPGGIVRHDSYAFQAGLDRAVRHALDEGTGLDLNATTHLDGPGRLEPGEMDRVAIAHQSLRGDTQN